MSRAAFQPSLFHPSLPRRSETTLQTPATVCSPARRTGATPQLFKQAMFGDPWCTNNLNAEFTHCYMTLPLCRHSMASEMQPKYGEWEGAPSTLCIVKGDP